MLGGSLDALDAVGYVSAPGLIGAERVAEMAGAMWGALRDRFGITEASADTWPVGDRRTVGRAVKDDTAFAWMASSPLVEAVDAFLGVGNWVRPRHWGSPMEIVFPAAAGSVWSLPTKAWHVDYRLDLGCRPLPGVKAIVLLDEVAPDGGATLVVSGSHRVLAGSGGGGLGRVEGDPVVEHFRNTLSGTADGVTLVADVAGLVVGVVVRLRAWHGVRGFAAQLLEGEAGRHPGHPRWGVARPPSPSERTPSPLDAGRLRSRVGSLLDVGGGGRRPCGRLSAIEGIVRCVGPLPGTQVRGKRCERGRTRPEHRARTTEHPQKQLACRPRRSSIVWSSKFGASGLGLRWRRERRNGRHVRTPSWQKAPGFKSYRISSRALARQRKQRRTLSARYVVR